MGEGRFWGLMLSGFFDNGLWLAGVFGPGAVVEGGVFCAGDFEGQGDDGGGYSGAAGGGDGLLKVYVLCGEEVAEGFGRFEAAFFDQLGEGDAGCAGPDGRSDVRAVHEDQRRFGG